MLNISRAGSLTAPAKPAQPRSSKAASTILNASLRLLARAFQFACFIHPGTSTPRFSTKDRAGNGRGGIASREQPPELSEEQINLTLKELADRADRRKRMKAKLLLIVVDGIERARIVPSAGARVVLEVGESAEVLEVRARDDEGEARIGVHLLDYHDDEPGEPRIYGVKLEGGWKLSLEVRVKRTSEGGLDGAFITIEYEKSKLPEAMNRHP